MPPRKSNVSAAAAEDSPKPPPKPAEDDGLSVEDLNLPKSMVQRLAKGVLPPNTQIQKDALLAMSKSATVFVNYITDTATQNALRSGKKTVMPKDVFDALQELEFEFMLQRVEAEVHKFTSIQADKRNTYRKKVREEKKAAKDKVVNGVEEESPPAKRARRSDGAEQAGSDEEEVDETVEEVEQEEEEEAEDDEVEEEAPDDEPTEDLLEEREKEEDDDEMADGDESD